jgi:hypothetical protein
MKQNYFSTMISRAAMMLFVVLCSLTAWAQDYTKDGVNYFIEGDAAYVGSSPDATGAITILDKITVSGIDYPVKSITFYAFYQNYAITSVVIPNSVEVINDYAFQECESLVTVTIGTGVTYIGGDVFYQSTAITDVYMYANPEVLTWWDAGYDDFKSDGSTICHVEDASLWVNKFSNVRIKFRDPNTVPFSWSYDASTHTLTISGNERMPNNRPWSDYASEITTVVIEQGVPNIASDAFNSCYSLTSVTIPSSVTCIDYNAFYDCISLQSIDIPASVRDFNCYSFSGCSSLTTVNIADDNPECKSIDGAVYSKDGSILFMCPAGKSSFTFAEGVKTVDSGAFNGCTKMSSITIPNGVEEINDCAFDKCDGLTSIFLPASITYINPTALSYCNNLTSIFVANDNPEYKSIDGVLYSKDGTKLLKFPHKRTSVNIPGEVTTIGIYAFQNTDLTAITIPDNVTTIEAWAFNDCSNLTTVTFGAGLTKIEGESFYYSFAITDVYCYADPNVLEWFDSYRDDFMNEAATVCHVNASDVELCNTKYGEEVRITFQGDLLPRVETAELLGTNLTTYYNGTDNVKVDAGTQVFKVTMNGSQLSATEVEDRIIKAGEGVVLKSQGETIAMATTTEESAADYSDNILDGVDVDTSKPVGYHYYTLSEYNGDLAFIEIPGNKLLAHKAYLKTTSSPFAYYFDDATGIGLMEEGRSQMEDGAIYSLAGQRLQKMQRGINIVGGKKMAVK